MAVMTERGVGDTSLKAIAEQACVTRATIYNNWPDRAALLADAITHMTGNDTALRSPDEAPDPLATIRKRVLGLALALGGDWGRVAASLAAEAEHDEDLAVAHRQHTQARRDELASLVEQAKRAGQLPDSIDAHWAVNLLVGPLYFERLVMHRQLSRRLLMDHLDRTLQLLTAMR